MLGGKAPHIYKPYNICKASWCGTCDNNVMTTNHLGKTHLQKVSHRRRVPNWHINHISLMWPPDVGIMTSPPLKSWCLQQFTSMALYLAFGQSAPPWEAFFANDDSQWKYECHNHKLKGRVHLKRLACCVRKRLTLINLTTLVMFLDVELVTIPSYQLPTSLAILFHDTLFGLLLVRTLLG